MGFFDAFYVMSYTASTIGFGEIPYPFTYNQRMWVTISIYLTVIGWAYAIGSLLALLQDRAFRQALALQHFTPQGGPAARAVPADRRVRADRGAARATRSTRSGRRFVVLDRVGRADRRPRAGLLPRRRPGPGRPTRATPGTSPSPGWTTRPARRSSRSPTTTRRTSPSPWPRRCCARTLPVIARVTSPDARRADAGVRQPEPWSTRSTGSATTCGWRCARRRPTSC